MGYRSSTQKYHHCHWKEWNLRVQSDGQAPSRSVVVQKWTTATVFRVRSLCCPSWYRPDLSSVHKFLSGEDRDPPTLPYWWRSIAEICAVSWIGWSFRGKKFVSRNNQSDQTQISVMHFWINKETTKFREETISVLAGFHLGPLSWSNWNLEMLRREKNWRTRRKTLGARRDPKTNSFHVCHRVGIEPGPHYSGGRRALWPLQHPCSQYIGFSLHLCRYLYRGEIGITLKMSTLLSRKWCNKIWLRSITSISTKHHHNKGFLRGLNCKIYELLMIWTSDYQGES